MEWPLLFKSTESRRRSSINYYFRFFRLREDRKAGGIGGTQKRERETERERERAEPPTLFLIYSSCLRFLLESKRKKKE